MATELHIVITAVSAREVLDELIVLGERAAKELGAGRPAPDTPDTSSDPTAAGAKGNGEDAAVAANAEMAKRRGFRGFDVEATGADDGDADEPLAPAKAPRTRKRPLVGGKPPSRDEIVKGLTDLFVDGELAVRDRITAFRDQHGVQRLRELGDEALPNALALLTELRGHDDH